MTGGEGGTAHALCDARLAAACSQSTADLEGQPAQGCPNPAGNNSRAAHAAPLPGRADQESSSRTSVALSHA